MTSLTRKPTGEITLPDSIRERYAMKPETPIRLIETRSGVLLVPLTNEPMSAELAQELAEWQSLTVQTWNEFPYADN